jgi:predicted PurR-regulated permease PerM
MSPFLAILIAGIVVFVPLRYFARWLQRKGRDVEKND